MGQRMPITEVETEESEDDTEIGALSEIYLQDESCWVCDADSLAHDSEAEGVIAVQYRGGDIFYLDGETRQWVNAAATGKPKSRLHPVN